MTAYCVFLPASKHSSDVLGNFRLVPDTRATLALVAPPLWLAWHRLWLPLLAYTVVIATLILMVQLTSQIWLLYASALPAFYLFLEGNHLIGNRLIRSGWQYAGTYEGDTPETAEIRYLMSANAVAGPVVHQQPAQVEKRPLSTPVTAGLFPE